MPPFARFRWFRRPKALAAVALSASGIWGRSAAAQTTPTTAAMPAVATTAEGDTCADEAADGSCTVGTRSHTGSVAAFVDFAGRSSSLGLGYLQMATRRASFDPSQRSDWYAYGLNGRMFMGGAESGPRAFGALATGRIGAARRVGLALELSAGAVRGDGHTLGVGSAGLFATIFYVDVGYTYQLPLGGDRPEWLGSHLVSLRAHLPIIRWGNGDWRTTDSWFPGS
jgi:hypothetical protein